MLIRAKKTTLVAVLALGIALSGCNFAVDSSSPTATLTASPSATVTATPKPTDTLAPSSTPTDTLTPTRTPTSTVTPVPSGTPTPSATPYPASAFLLDQWDAVDVPAAVKDGLSSPWYAISSINERTGGASNPDTPVPEREDQTLYLINPNNGEQIPIVDLPVSAGDRVFWAPDGKKLLYFLEPTLLPDNTRAAGLYLVNLSLGVSLRLFDIPSLNPRGIPDHEPVWSPDSSKVAIALPTAYDVDIFVVSSDGSVFQNVTAHGAFDLWPAWSPDGRRLAFVSDRRQCSTWVPGEPGSCSRIDAVTPSGGNLFLLDVLTGSVQLVSEMQIDGPPQWVSNLKIAFSTGLSDPLAAESNLWLASIQAGSVRGITDLDGSLNLGAAWSPEGRMVLYHRVSEPAAIVLKDATGTSISSRDDFLFSRFGFAADWSPEGEWIAFGGRNGQCPYGMIVAQNSLEVFFRGTSPLACDPSFSPDGRWLAYAGIQSRTGAADGRLDLYISNANGYNARNLTSTLRGEIQLLGWVGPAS